VATVPVPTTWVDGTVVHGSDLNTQVRDSVNFLLGPPMCQVNSVSGIASLANATNSAAITFDAETYDNDNMHSIGTNPSRVIIQTLGWFDIQTFIGYAGNATGQRYMQLRLNSAGSATGGTFITSNGVGVGDAHGAAFSPAINITYQAVNVGDYFEIFGWQSSGGALAITGGQYNTGLTARWVHN